MLPPDHPARAAWAFAEGVDLSPLYAAIKAVEGHPGHPHIDPRLLFALWPYATLDGVGSARELCRLVVRPTPSWDTYGRGHGQGLTPKRLRGPAKRVPGTLSGCGACHPRQAVAPRLGAAAERPGSPARGRVSGGGRAQPLVRLTSLTVQIHANSRALPRRIDSSS